jgi:hypothetical protein
MGTGGLHGCTVIAIISKRAARMVCQDTTEPRLTEVHIDVEQTHIWEVGAVLVSADEEIQTDDLTFQSKTTNLFLGSGTIGASEQAARYGRQVPFNLMNQPDDNALIV